MIGLENDLGVSFREKPIPLAAQLASQLAEIVDAAVEDQAKAEFTVEHRLLRGGGEVEDAQAAVTERHGPLRENARRIRPPRQHGFRHSGQACERDISRSPQFSANSTHAAISELLAH